MNDADLLRRIRLGEDSALELKRVLLDGAGRITGPRRDAFADELAGLANAKGGVVVLGVDDRTRAVLGIPLEALDTVEGWVHEICNDLVEAPSRCGYPPPGAQWRRWPGWCRSFG